MCRSISVAKRRRSQCAMCTTGSKNIVHTGEQEGLGQCVRLYQISVYIKRVGLHFRP
jgi:hypothetical protein